MASYIPNRDSLLLAWAQNFATTLTANPATYGLTAGDAAAITAAQQAYTTAFGVATTDATRTPVTIADKDTKRAQLVLLLRSYSAIIQANLGISASAKSALGLTIRDTKPTQIAAPVSAPTLGILAAFPGQLSATYHDPNQGPKVKAKPAGVTAMEVYAATSATVVTDPATLPFQGLVTRTPFTVNFGSGDKGKTAYVAARWVTRRGLVGPWSSIATFTVA